jgi:uncharacterized protein (DUF58 family)
LAGYVDSKTLERIKRLDVRARLVVEGFIAGGHRSPYHGFAVEFATHREYSPGDDLRHLDWKVWSRSDRLYIKEYEEETNLQCTLVVDASRSMQYGGDWRKYDYAATAAASLAYLLQRQQDAVGLVTFAGGVLKNLPPSSHPNQIKLLINELETTTPAAGTDLASVFPALAQQIRRRGLVVLVSDLFVPRKVLADLLRQLAIRKHETIVLQVLHSDEVSFPFGDQMLFRGLEERAELRCEPRALKRSYLAAMARFTADVRSTCARAGVDYVLLNTGEPLDAALGSYLAFRRKVRRTAYQR